MSSLVIDLEYKGIQRSLKLSIKGEANVHWKKDSDRDCHFRANEHYINLTYYLFGNTIDSSSDEEVRMPAGFHKYPFTFSLPSNIPCSFEHVNGHIRYTTKAIIDRPWRIDHKCKIAFTVVSPYDLDNHSQQCLGIDDEMSDSFCSFYCADMGSIKARIKIPTTGFLPGQSIKTLINLNNTSSVNVTKICVKLERFLKFHAKTPYNSTKTNKAVIKAEQNTGPFSQYEGVMLLLQVPPIPPSQLEYCNIIDQNYILRITIHVSGMHCNITKTYPILIGTIPLRSVPHTQTIQPTAPMMQYDDDAPPPMPTFPDYASPNLPYPRSQLLGFAIVNQPSTSIN